MAMEFNGLTKEMTKDDIRDVAILVTEHLLDYSPDLLHPDVAEVRDEYTPATFDLQDTIAEALTEILAGRTILKIKS